MRKILFLATVIFCVVFNPEAFAAEGKHIPRTIIALYDSKIGDIEFSNLHKMVEMPLNHLGLKVEYYDIHKPLPEITKREDVRGVVAWLFFDTNMQNPEAYLKWALDVVNAGKKYVILGTLGVMGGKSKPSLTEVNSLMGKLGMKMTNGWTETAFDVKYSYKNTEILLSKEPFKWLRPSYETVEVTDAVNTTHLSALRGNNSEENSDLIISGPLGGYISSGYIMRVNNIDGALTRQWLIDPFEYFRLALATDDLPKPDTTTIAGRRLYYSHIDGDGFNSITQLEEYRDKNILSAQVIMDKAVKPYPDLPVTLTAIAADIDPAWSASASSRDIAKEFFALPQVEAGSHTYSHPFNWSFFEDGDSNKETPYLRLYPQNSVQTVWRPDGIEKKPSFFTAMFSDELLAKPMPSGYAIPRAYAHEPFNIKKEIYGSISAIKPLLPKDKRVEIIMWSGDCSPWEEALNISRLAGVQNINGGDTIFDSRNPTYANVAPIGRQVGKELQIYASTSNEIPYTKEWTQDFDAYRHLVDTLINTETPIRLKPVNIYYHLYSGEREAGLNALLTNIKYARSQAITPITTSHYTHIAEGFFKANLINIENDVWNVNNRGALQTIRFDRHSFKSVDLLRSKGVIGQHHFQGSLYVYLDAAVENAVIALKKNPDYAELPQENISYLKESRWLIYNLRRRNNQMDFTAKGFGAGEMIWQVPKEGNYRIRINGKGDEIVSSRNRQLKLILEHKALQPIHVTITKV